MLLNEIFGFGSENTIKHAEGVKRFIRKGSPDAQETGNSWFNSFIGVLRGNTDESIIDTIRDLRVKFHQAIDIDNCEKAANRFEKARNIFTKARDEASKKASVEIRNKYDNDDYDVYPPFD